MVAKEGSMMLSVLGEGFKVLMYFSNGEGVERWGREWLDTDGFGLVIKGDDEEEDWGG